MKERKKKRLKTCGKILLVLFLAIFAVMCAIVYEKSPTSKLEAKAEEVTASAAPTTQPRASSGIDLSKYPTANLMPIDNVRMDNCTYDNGVVTQVKADSSIINVWKIQVYNSADIESSDYVEFNSLGRIRALTFTKTSESISLRFGLNGKECDTALGIDIGTFPNGKYTIAWTILSITQGSVSWNDIQLNSGETAYPYSPPYDLIYNDGYNKGESAGYQEGYDEAYDSAIETAQYGFWQGSKIHLTAHLTNSSGVQSTDTAIYTPIYTSQGIFLDSFRVSLPLKYAGYTINSVDFSIVFSSPVPEDIFKSNIRVTGPSFVFGSDRIYTTTIEYNNQQYKLNTRYALVPDGSNLYGIQFEKSSFPLGTFEGSNNFYFVSLNLSLTDLTGFTGMSFYSKDGYFTSGYNDGYNDGVDDGYKQGETAGKQQGYKVGYEDGFNVGYESGLEKEPLSSSVKSFLFSLFDAPVNTFMSVFNFEYDGFDFSALAALILTGLVVIGVIKLL